ncbi:MAG: hypothetical protein BWY92_01016 [Firmicutes bacterium ADurb.BinA052]|nr:MAG: hypothetical protein BWY92_01016 [Firmicutes bacterium ADurb.BinA052]
MYDAKGQEQPSLGAVAVLISTRVGHRRHELVKQIPVCTVQLHTIKARLCRTSGTRSKGFDHLVYLLGVHGDCSRFTGRCPDGRWGNGRLADHLSIGSCARMSQLDHSPGAVAMNLVHQRSQRIHVGIGYQAQLSSVPPARGLDVGVFNDDEAYTARGPSTVVLTRFGCDVTFFVSCVACHRGHDNPVFELEPAYVDWRKQT